uniref:hypothetical protein n=1 Tax=Paenisporosarcina sp. TG20 TaxID=1211706 RepID=UPI000592B309
LTEHAFPVGVAAFHYNLLSVIKSTGIYNKALKINTKNIVISWKMKVTKPTFRKDDFLCAIKDY